MARTATRSYFQSHKRQLKRIIETYEQKRAGLDLFMHEYQAKFNVLESGITRYPLRYYQLEAVYVLDHLCDLSKSLRNGNHSYTSKSESLVGDLVEVIDKETDFKAPFIGFEMATGSGKTMLMGACIYFLNQWYGIDNFLIITPASTDIYQKTIRNFQVGTFESVWADDTPFTFNLITGDNYTQNLFYDESKDANIFVFNISKFGANAVNTEKPWESSVWKDKEGNTVSIKQFLKDKKLAIITDEAHHAQTPTANRIIKKFRPEAVLEFTATAVEAERNEKKKNQSIVYKYDIRRFLEDGYGKLVRAVGLSSQSKNGKSKEVAQSEKLKIITLFFIHLLKKEAVLQDPKSRELKPIAFIKVKNDTQYTQKVFDYVKNELASDTENLKYRLGKD